MNNMNSVKIIGVALLFISWFALVIIGKAPADNYVNGIMQTLAALGIYHSVNRSSLS